MRTMSDEAEPRVCDEDFGSDEEGEEADVESYLEDNSSELMDRLRELEAENSALMLANESQREAYERCLDEVANHVVQALLNQKDLREECIKLKMLVFDLERQNRALCELFQQKLPNHPPAHYQVQAGPLPDNSSQMHNDSAKQVEPAQTEAQAKGNGYCTQHASPGSCGTAASMEALSPFFKKKAHILEVLRKMEETDPLKFHPSTTTLPFCDYSQVLISTEAVLASADPLPRQCKSHHTFCHCSCLDTHQHVNSDGSVKCEGGDTCCLRCKRSPDSPSKPCNHVCTPLKVISAAQSYVAPDAAAASDCHSKTRTDQSVPPSKQMAVNEVHQQPAVATGNSSLTEMVRQSLELVKAERDKFESHVKSATSEDLSALCAPAQLPNSGRECAQISLCDVDTGDGIGKDVALSSNAILRDTSAVQEKDGTDEEASSVRASASVSPSPSCLSDVKAAAINSPSKLLKFLKIPSMGEKCQASPSAVRLSPQLTRNSRIPCRTNNYEVYHSPVPSRRVTTAERCRQPPPPPSRSESYPATHSAPTSPPQPEDVCPLPVKDISYSSLSAPKASAGAGLKSGASTAPSSCSPKVSQRVPHYENVCDISSSREDVTAKDLERRTTLSSQGKANGGERKLIKSLPESVLNPPPRQKQSSSSTSESTSGDEEDSDSPVWVNHHSLPTSSAVSKAQSRVSYSQTREKQEVEVREVSVASSDVTQPPTLVRKSDSSSIPKRPTAVAARSQPDSSHHAFKDRLAALGKLKSSEDLQAGLRLVDTNEGTYGEERSKTVERPMDKEEHRHSKYTDSLDGKPKMNSVGLKCPGTSQIYEQAVKFQSSANTGAKQELCVAKVEGPKSKIGLLSPSADAPQVLRNNIKCPGSLNLSYNVKAPQCSNSPNKIPPKSPSRPCQGPSFQRGGKASEAPRYSSKSEERSKISGKGKKNPLYGDSLPPPPPRPPVSEGEKPLQPVPSPQSAIEQKVMKGIEENVLKLQEQDRGGQGSEVKQKASNGIASWFGLKKSKLPALSRKTDATKAKDEKKEWKINIPSVGRDPVKMATRCKEGVEGLNISTLMEKAEGLRRALEEERAYVERSGRGHSCEVVMDQAQGQLAVMYRGGRSDNFMQQLLNRVDGKDVISVPQRRLSFDCKTSKPVFSQQSEVISHTSSHDDMEKGCDRIGKLTSDENLSDSVHSQHFAGSGASTYTLDSGIGTFPLPDCSSSAAGRSLTKTRGGAELLSSDSPGRAGRRARTLDREPTSQEECMAPHKQLIPTIQYGSVLEARTAGVIHEEKEVHGANMFSPRSKTWTFPNLKTPSGPAEVYLAVEEEEEEVVSFGSPYRGSTKASTSSSGRVDPGNLPLPAPAGLSRRGKARPPSGPEVSPAGLELLRERPEEALSPSRPQVLETPESLSDSLYDSLSSCGSQG
ncbi:nck-associated protein 5-like [Cololabis saira]|uniref:nck-associated protein 5-like n=1 Tax=Cololabis saira TaxID=129043 RepID=UPI002AD24562|nr:nck-associated protein 5-like [Cololabis saira]XP_061591111.1 nck-associated protein 5-like [Cololabis saira]XP_061591113.1 nck-associated protein 5-like [Cololabis saira]XP_061591114.1 nck-associated protein 5-like [Cololabis saira]XP_061591115.1 nck-associated protein 5-like [Cololabis saira]XP_061591116.1 nck-associated protein 5-like [Cololabis saira]XP_061591117.1 nck-associated protein 5-like [Cololabis saira]